MRRPRRSARIAILVTSLLLVAVPLAMLLVSYLYERLLVVQYEGRLHALAERVAAEPNVDLHALGTREGVEIVRLDGTGKVLGRSDTSDEAMRRSTLGGYLEAVIEEPFPAVMGSARTPFSRIQEGLGPLADRPAVQRALGGQLDFTIQDSANRDALVVTLAAPSDGGAIVVMKESLRGMRRLLFLRGELLKLLGAQVLFAVLMFFVLSRWLVRPLEQLAQAVREYPAKEILQPELAGRRDEIGELARAVGAVTHSLDAKRKGAAELAADLAHELKNPLATIAASAELIASTSDPSPEKRAMVQGHIQGAVERMRDTTDELLRLMRLDVSLGELLREEVDYRALVDSVLAEYRRDPRWAEWKFTLEGPAELPRVRLVPSAWGKLLRNLVDNALVQPAERKEIVVSLRRSKRRPVHAEHADPTGTGSAGASTGSTRAEGNENPVHPELSEGAEHGDPAGSARAGFPGDSLVTEVRDFGPGVSEGNRDKIFRRFFTQRPEGVPPGTGLGLSIVQTVAESHRGRVEVDSPPGGGALFRVWLPL